jgi:hypothetical protein
MVWGRLGHPAMFAACGSNRQRNRDHDVAYPDQAVGDKIVQKDFFAIESWVAGRRRCVILTALP